MKKDKGEKMKDKQGNIIHRLKGSNHKPVFLTVRQAYKLLEFLEDFEFEFNKYTQQATVIEIALRRIIPKRYLEGEIL
jgi:hypothetical protein